MKMTQSNTDVMEIIPFGLFQTKKKRYIIGDRFTKDNTVFIVEEVIDITTIRVFNTTTFESTIINSKIPEEIVDEIYPIPF